MQDAVFSDEFCRFLQSAVPDVDAAELLLALADRANEWCEPADLLLALGPATALREADVRRYLELFQARALIAVGPDKRVQYRPGTDTLAAHVGTLAQAYKERPVTLFRVIYAMRDLKIQSFADAFKLGKK